MKEANHTMKVIAFNGSAREDGNTAIHIKYVLGELAKAGIETEVVSLAGKAIHGCRACYRCSQNQDKHCSVKDDVLNECIEKMLEARGIILGSPTYFANVSTELKALIDRAGLVAIANSHVCVQTQGRCRGGRGATRRQHPRFQLHQPLLPHQSDDHPGSSYWNGYGPRRRRRGTRRRRHNDHENAGPGPAVEANTRISTCQSALPIMCTITRHSVSNDG